jgi:hypothetical protein
MDHVILNFNNNMSTVALFLDIGKALDATWHLGLLCKLSAYYRFPFSENLQSFG